MSSRPKKVTQREKFPAKTGSSVKNAVCASTEQSEKNDADPSAEPRMNNKRNNKKLGDVAESGPSPKKYSLGSRQLPNEEDTDASTDIQKQIAETISLIEHHIGIETKWPELMCKMMEKENDRFRRFSKDLPADLEKMSKMIPEIKNNWKTNSEQIMKHVALLDETAKELSVKNNLIQEFTGGLYLKNVLTEAFSMICTLTKQLRSKMLKNLEEDEIPAEIQRIMANPDLNQHHASSTTPTSNADDFFSNVKDADIASRDFLVEFKLLEALVFKYNPMVLEIFEDGTLFNKTGEEFTKAFLIKNIVGLGMQQPEGMNFNNIHEYLRGGEKIYNVINSLDQKKDFGEFPLKDIEQMFKNDAPREEILMVMSTGGGDIKKSIAYKEFQVPQFVSSNCLITELTNALQKKKGKREGKKKPKSTEDALDISDASWYINSMPEIHKYYYLLMADSFLDVTMETGGTATFFYIKKGKLTVYIAPRTEENIATYEEHKRGRNTDWIGGKLLNQWTRVVLEEGNFLLIPGSFLYFSHVQEDSIVIAGNFFSLHDVENHFKRMKFEESPESKITFEERFQEFWGVMFCYLQYVLIPKIKESPANSACPYKKAGKIFLEHMSNDKTTVWYERDRQTEVLNDLKKALRTEMPSEYFTHETDPDQPCTSSSY